MNEILRMLTGGDLRSEGRAAEVAVLVGEDPESLPALAAGLALEDKLLRARTCMSLEVLSRTRPELVQPLAPDLIRTAEREAVAQARWHLAEIFYNVALDRGQVERAIPILLRYLEDKSKIVRVCAVRALGVLGKNSRRRSDIAAEIRRHEGAGKGLAKAVARALEELGISGPRGDATG
jgi:HEAT repeat protein